jgi:hypothetical protein
MADSLATVFENARVAEQDAPPPPPPMPEATLPPAMPEVTPPPAMPEPTPAPAPVTTAAPATTAAPTTTETDTPPPVGGWDVDTYRLRTFGETVVRARSYLDSVQKRVERMQGAELTPQLGTSPVGEQLAKKFDDRLNSADGLRAMLAEAMKRMDRFVTSAEQAARSYEEADQVAAENLEHEDDEPS